MPAAKHIRTLWKKTFGAIRRDPQKAGILTVLVAILVVLQVRLFSGKSGPNKAKAGTAVAKTDKSPTGGSATSFIAV